MGEQASIRILHQEDGEEGLTASFVNELRILFVMKDVGQKWGDICRSVPSFASYVEGRFAAHEHHVIATVRRDGSPRVSGTNVMFTNGTLWIGMMPHALRTLDLQRMQHCALHSAPLNEKLPNDEGDVRLNAVARELIGEELESLFRAQFPETKELMPGNFFELLPTEISFVEVNDEHIVITHWSPTKGIVVTKHQ